MATNNPPYNSPETRELRKAVKHPRLKFTKEHPSIEDVIASDVVSSNKPKLVHESPFDSVKVFSATKHNDRAALGELITDWIRAHPGIEIVDKVVTQSSDSEFHCITITLFYRSAE